MKTLVGVFCVVFVTSMCYADEIEECMMGTDETGYLLSDPIPPGERLEIDIPKSAMMHLYSYQYMIVYSYKENMTESASLNCSSAEGCIVCPVYAMKELGSSVLLFCAERDKSCDAVYSFRDFYLQETKTEANYDEEDTEENTIY